MVFSLPLGKENSPVQLEKVHPKAEDLGHALGFRCGGRWRSPCRTPHPAFCVRTRLLSLCALTPVARCEGRRGTHVLSEKSVLSAGVIVASHSLATVKLQRGHSYSFILLLFHKHPGAHFGPLVQQPLCPVVCFVCCWTGIHRQFTKRKMGGYSVGHRPFS